MLVRSKITPIKKVGLILIFILLILGAGYLIYANFWSKTPSSTSNQATKETSDSQSPVVTKFNQEIFTSPQMINLEKYGDWGYTNQYEATATDANIPTGLLEAKVLDPGTGDKLYLFWQLPPKVNFNKIRIYRSNNLGQTGEVIIELSASETFYQDNNLQKGVNYYYTLKTVNEALKESENAEPLMGKPSDTTPPSPPEEVKVYNLEDGGSIVITWLPAEDKDFDYIKIYRSTEKGKLGNLIKDKSVSLSENQVNEYSCGEKGKNHYCFKDQVIPNVTYYYTLTSVDIWGNESSERIVTNPPRTNPFESLTSL